MLNNDPQGGNSAYNNHNASSGNTPNMPSQPTQPAQSAQSAQPAGAENAADRTAAYVAARATVGKAAYATETG